jgi:hypothetical protein
MLGRSLAATAVVVALVVAGARQSAELRCEASSPKTLDDVVDIARKSVLAKGPYTDPASERLLNSDEFKRVYTDDYPLGWKITPYNSSDFVGHIARLRFDDGEFDGNVYVNVNSCGSVTLSEFGSWPRSGSVR